jgi:hypothetical protein
MRNLAGSSDRGTTRCTSSDQLHSRSFGPKSMIRFPFWLVIPDSAQQPPKSMGPDEPLPLVFAAAGEMAAYLALRKGGNWDVRLVNRYSVTQSIADVLQQGYSAIWHGVQADGSGGTKMAIADFLSILDPTPP